MPDTKISALPAVGAAADAQQIPVNDAGTTKMLTVSQLDAYILRALHVPSTALAANSVTDTKLRDSAATSVIGRAGAAGGDPADITAGADNRALVRHAGALSFDQIVAADVTAGTLTHTQMADRSRKLLVPCVAAYNATDATDITRASAGGWPLPDAKLCRCYGNFYLPSDWASGLTATAVVIPGATGNLYSASYVFYGGVGQSYLTHTDSVGFAATAVTNNLINEEQVVTPASLAAGDYLSLRFERDASNVLDTLGAEVNFMGWLVSYTADM